MSSTDHITLAKNAGSLEISTPYDGYSKVVIIVGQDDDGNDIVYTAGDNTGTTLEIENPFGTQAMANSILASLKGWQYQPYTAQDALLDPSAEMGDAVTVNKVYSGIYYKSTKYNALTVSEISAPQSQEIENEAQQLSPTLRSFSRSIKEVKASLALTEQSIAAEVAARTAADEELESTLNVTATQIAAKVSKTGGSSSSFGWNLTDSAWTVYSGSKEVLKVNASGMTVKGAIQAESGYIGGANGFTITANKIYKNISQFGGTQSSGVYIGTDGIQLGQGFKVSSSGALTATSGTFGSLSVNSSGNTVGSYRGSLGGCGGSLSTGISIGSTNIATYVKNLVAETVTASIITSVISNATVLDTKVLRVTSGLVVGSSASFTFKNNSIALKSKSFVTKVSPTYHKTEGYITGITVSTSTIKYLGAS